MILIFSSIFDHYKYALAFFPFMHVPFQEQPKSLHSSQQHILVRLCMCVTEQPCPLFHPEKTEIFRLHPASSLSNTPPHPSLPPPPPSFDPPLQPRWKDDRARKERVEREGKGRERCDSSSTSVAHRGKRERGRERERKKKGELF